VPVTEEDTTKIIESMRVNILFSLLQKQIARFLSLAGTKTDIKTACLLISKGIHLECSLIIRPLLLPS
jgi:acyl transferase domain-containing protein